MGEVRAVREADLEQMAQVHLNAQGHIGNTVDEVVRGYTVKVPELILNHRYSAHASPSLVFEQDGDVHGFVLVGCQPVVFSGERLWSASTSHLMVDPNARSSLAAVHLLRAVIEGPQDLVFVDRSNTAGRVALQAAGFEQLPASSLRWRKVLQRGTARSQQLASRTRISISRATDVAQQGERLAGRLLRRSLHAELPESPRGISIEELTTEHVADNLSNMLTAADLHPDFSDIGHLEHTWRLIERSRPNSSIIAHAVLNPRGRTLGWYIMDINEFGHAEVVQMMAVDAHRRTVLLQALTQAQINNAVIVEGRLPLDLIYPASDLGCTVTSSEATSIHTSKPKLLDCFQQGRALLSPLEGEFLINPVSAVPR